MLEYAILHAQELKAALDQFADVGVCKTKITIDKTLTQNTNHIHVGT
jgi:hypothetical protein